MATKFEDLINDMVNIGFGVAAVTAEKGKEVLGDLNAKGAEARADARQSDFARSMADIFQQAGGVFTDATDRLGLSNSAVAERILDELILARLRALSMSERIEFLAHVRDLADTVDEGTVTVEVESVEEEDADAPAAAPAGEPGEAEQGA